MRSVLLVSAHELRTRWQAWVSLALLVAFAGGCVLTAAAGARRTGSAYQRFLVASKASDVGRSKIAGWLAGTGAPVTAAAGVRLALEPGRGRTAVPARSAVIGAALSVLAVTAAFTFGVNLLHLVHTPACTGRPGTPRSTWTSAVSRRRRRNECWPAPPASPAGPTAITERSGSAARSFPRSG
jgi:hypothetical protein